MPGETVLPGAPGARPDAASGGRPDELGRSLQACRNYLLLVANRGLDVGLRSKGGASDLVQETFLEAQRASGRFEGGSEEELRAWLRQILLRRLAHFSRRYRGTERRRAGREVSLDAGGAWADPASSEASPSGVAIRREQEGALRWALDRLPGNYREAVLWRHREGLGFEEIGRRLGCSPEAARKVWVRAVERLRREMKGAGDVAGTSP